MTCTSALRGSQPAEYPRATMGWQHGIGPRASAQTRIRWHRPSRAGLRVHVCACTRACIIYVYMYVYTHRCIRMCVCVLARVCVCVRECLCVCAYVRVWLYMGVCVDASAHQSVSASCRSALGTRCVCARGFSAYKAGSGSQVAWGVLQGISQTSSITPC